MLRAKYFSTVLSFTAIFDSGCLIWWGWVGFGWMEENKKSGGRYVRASKPAIGDGVLWISPCKRKAHPEAQLGDNRYQK